MDMHTYLELKRDAILRGANRFFLPSGLAADKCLAAYQFAGVSSESYALQDLSGNGRDLKKGSQTYSGTTYAPTWSSSGFKFDAVYGGNSGYLNNGTLNTLSIVCAVVRYSGLTQNNRGPLITAGGASGKVQIYGATSAYAFDSYGEDGELINAEYRNYVGPGFAASAQSGTWAGTMYYSPTQKTAGVIGVNFTANKMYLDGALASTSSTPSGKTFTGLSNKYTFGTSHSSHSPLNNAVWAGRTIIAAAFFSVELSKDQHAEVAEAMLAI